MTPPDPVEPPRIGPQPDAGQREPEAQEDLDYVVKFCRWCGKVRIKNQDEWPTATRYTHCYASDGPCADAPKPVPWHRLDLEEKVDALEKRLRRLERVTETKARGKR